MSERDDFGPGLRRERERRGISLQQIADKTKISASVFAALERNDLSRWPNGIFRRSFLRAYAEAVGIDSTALVRQFVHLFPCGDESDTAVKTATVAAAPVTEHRERQAPPRVTAVAAVAAQVAGEPGSTGIRARLAAAGIDVGCIAVLAASCWALFGWVAVWPGVAVAATLIFVVGRVVFGATIGTRLLRKPKVVRSAMPEERPLAVRRSTTAEPHQASRRHQVRRTERPRSRVS